jgi:hypothetical protein
MRKWMDQSGRKETGKKAPVSANNLYKWEMWDYFQTLPFPKSKLEWRWFGGHKHVQLSLPS